MLVPSCFVSQGLLIHLPNFFVGCFWPVRIKVPMYMRWHSSLLVVVGLYLCLPLAIHFGTCIYTDILVLPVLLLLPFSFCHSCHLWLYTHFVFPLTSEAITFYLPITSLFCNLMVSAYDEYTTRLLKMALESSFFMDLFFYLIPHFCERSRETNTPYSSSNLLFSLLFHLFFQL
jgi:hypothetical protein